jgi:alcohol dehydrogenase class IV
MKFPFIIRLFQRLMFALTFIIRIPLPKKIVGAGKVFQTVDILTDHHIKRVLIVGDTFIVKHGMLDRLWQDLKEANIEYFIYDKVLPDPTIEHLEQAKKMYQMHSCQAIVGIGGGSSLDCAKGAAALIASKKTVPQLKGLLKVRRRPPLMIMIPTTAGTGSETTVAVVVSNPSQQEKYAISDPILVPQYAILDPLLVQSLPPHLTAYTGLDALTHALESQLNRFHTSLTKAALKEAWIGIDQYLVKSFKDGNNLQARQGMLLASYQAGVAFTRTYVGYIHGIAHTLGGFFHVPHGLANAIVLPYILPMYGKTIIKPLAEIADWLSLTKDSASDELKAEKVISYIKDLLKTLQIPDRLSFQINPTQIPLMIAKVFKEVHPLYPVPKFLSYSEIASVFSDIQGLSDDGFK